ncbi:uncharacterized protein [Chelonus insularis]|uniref:uncharacterized protein n=1 Tax=Chelonus insularis TaxID=460826 RepID=UPI00158EFCAE|nr:uncharacterized protein LOC118074515 [Chelonus insularis]
MSWNMSEPFTSNNVINNFQHNSNVSEISGFIDSIEGTKYVNGKNQWSIIINNDQGRRIRVVFWSDLAVKYFQKTKFHSIMLFKDIYCQRRPLNRRINQENLYHLQLIVKFYTTVNIFFEMFKPDLISQQATLKDVFLRQHQIQHVQGYLQKHFTLRNSPRYSYWSGIVNDRYSSVRVHILNHMFHLDLKIGQLISYLAESQCDRDGNYFLAVVDTRDIQVFDDIITEEKMRTEGGLLLPG